jgi:hypothetical protein
MDRYSLFGAGNGPAVVEESSASGWVEYDPTNGLVAGANLIRVGATREASQAIPISGCFVGNADDPIGLHVDVSVSAGPIR